MNVRSLNGFSRTFCLFVSFAVAGGCSGKPSSVEVPAIVPQEAAQAAIEQYDRNGDGQLSADELESCPALSKALGKYDTNRDRTISEEELIKRFSMWSEGGLGVSSLTCQLTLDGRPFSGALVKLVPEDCLSQWIHEATGTADVSGIVRLGIDSKYLPDDLKNFHGVHQGLYKIEITHPEIAVPARYNTETVHGMEVSFEFGDNYFPFAVSRR